MKVLLRNPRREVEIPGPLTVRDLLASLEIDPETVLVIRGDTLAGKDERIGDDESVEVRPVMSGGMSGSKSGEPSAATRPEPPARSPAVPAAPGRGSS